MSMDKNVITKKICITVAAVAGIYLFFKYIIRLILPFIIAFIIAFLLKNPVRLIHERTKIGKRILSAVFVILVVLVCGFFIFLLSNRLISEVERFASSLSENSDKYVAAFFEFIDRLAEKLPFIDQMGADLSGAVSNAIKSMLTTITSRIPMFIAYVVGMLPEILLFTVILIMASYYFCADFDEGAKKLESLLSPESYQRVLNFKNRLTNTGLSYLKACFILMFITFGELLVGFFMLGVPYAFTLALIVAAVDMLPILGVGTVLAPWSLFAWFSGDTYTAIGLVIINLTVTVVRRFIEPRVIGTGIGLSPVTTLVAMYIGFRLFGFTGLFFSPLAAILILHMLPVEVARKLGLNADESKQKEENNDGFKKEKKI